MKTVESLHPNASSRSKSYNRRNRKVIKNKPGMVNPIQQKEFETIMGKISGSRDYSHNSGKGSKSSSFLKENNYNLTNLVNHKEIEYRTKDKLQMNSNYALVGYLGELKRTEVDVKLEAGRMNYLNKDKQWLIKFCNQLKEELAICKDRVKVAEKIMHDLKACGQESVESLIKTIDSFEAKRQRLENEISHLTNIVDGKMKQSQEKAQKIEDCKNFIETQSGLQEQKIVDLSQQIGDKKAHILDLKRQIVALENKYEAQSNEFMRLGKEI